MFLAIWNRYIEAMNPPATLYHYCPAETFQKILRARNLRASDILRMNDPREVEYAFVDVIGLLVAEREDGHSKYFLQDLAPAHKYGIYGAQEYPRISRAFLPRQNCRASGASMQSAPDMQSGLAALLFRRGVRLRVVPGSA